MGSKEKKMMEGSPNSSSPSAFSSLHLSSFFSDKLILFFKNFYCILFILLEIHVGIQTVDCGIWDIGHRSGCSHPIKLHIVPLSSLLFLYPSNFRPRHPHFQAQCGDLKFRRSHERQKVEKMLLIGWPPIPRGRNKVKEFPETPVWPLPNTPHLAPLLHQSLCQVRTRLRYKHRNHFFCPYFIQASACSQAPSVTSVSLLSVPNS